MIDTLQRTREELDVALWAYVIMPEHVHVLLHPRAGHYEMRRILAALKPAIVDYIHVNPVRRGLVEQPTDWAWSSARFWQGWSDVPLRMDDPLG